jgi:CelD/BcsL family acetyltransferase involved in cellulose biosynthesis
MAALAKGMADRSSGVLLGERERTAVREGLRELDEVALEWDALADRAGAPVWWRPGWVRAWWRAFGLGRLMLVTVRRGERLVGVVPMERRGGDLRSPSNYHTPSFGLLAADETALASVATALVQAAPRRLTVKFLPTSEPTLVALENASRGAGRPRYVRVLERCPYLSLEGSWADLLESRRNQLVRELRRRRRRLHARGRFEMDVQDGRQDLHRYLEEGFAVEAAGWKGEGGTAIASSPATRGFYTEIAGWLAARGALRLTYLRLDGTPFAFEFAIEERGRHVLLKTGYDEAFRSDAPGTLLRAASIERAFERGLRRYDFLGKDDPWKREWTSTFETQVQLQSFRRSPDAMADWAAQRYLRPLAKRILRRP